MAIAKSLFAAAFVLVPSVLSAATFAYVADGGTNVDTSSVSQFDLVVTDTGTITDLNVAMVLSNDRQNVTFPGTIAWGDLNVSISKDGVTVDLWQAGNPGENDELYVALDDNSTQGETLNDVLNRAGGGQSDVVPVYPGAPVPVDPNNPGTSYDPIEALSAFNGLELAGTWTLSIFDTVVPNEGDELNGWMIYGATSGVAAVPVPASMPLLAAGLGGLAVWRRRKST